MAGPEAAPDTSISFRVGMTFDDVEREMLLKTLAFHRNNKRRAARALGITTKTIYNRLLRYRELGLIGDAEVGDLDRRPGGVKAQARGIFQQRQQRICAEQPARVRPRRMPRELFRRRRRRTQHPSPTR
jgi:transposase